MFRNGIKCALECACKTCKMKVSPWSGHCDHYSPVHSYSLFSICLSLFLSFLSHSQGWDEVTPGSSAETTGWCSWTCRETAGHCETLYTDVLNCINTVHSNYYPHKLGLWGMSQNTNDNGIQHFATHLFTHKIIGFICPWVILWLNS